jgi:hypothetical protein
MATNDKMRVVSVAGATGGGTQSLTISGFGTPTCAILITSRATVDATVVASGESIGFTDGTNEFMVGNRGRDNTNNEQTDNIWSDTGHLGWMLGTGANPASGDADFSFSQWVTDGIEITWNTAPTTAIQVTAILIQCANAQVFPDQTLNAQDIATTFTPSPTFAPQTVFFLNGFNGDPSSTIAPVFATVLGVADYNGSTVEQGFLGFRVSDGSSVGDPVARSSITRVGSVIVDAGSIEAGGFDSDSFTLTKRDTLPSIAPMGSLVIGWNGADRKVAGFDSPTGTATVDKSFTWPGFTPQFVLTNLNLTQAYETTESDADAGSVGISMFDEDGGEECISWAHEDASAKSNTESTHASNAIELHDDVGSALFNANFANGSMDASGYTLEFTALPSSTARKWVGFALEQEGAPPVAELNSRLLLLGVGI